MIIGLAGLKGSGKDTAGAYLVEHFGFTRVSFAAPLKQSAAALFDIPVEAWETAKNDPDAYVEFFDGAHVRLTAREFLQRYGTEAHRDVFGKDFWTKQLLDGLADHMRSENDPAVDFVITDMRFENETRATREAGGYTVLITRGGTMTTDTHASEELPDLSLIDVAVANDGSFAELYAKLDDVVAMFRDAETDGWKPPVVETHTALDFVADIRGREGD